MDINEVTGVKVHRHSWELSRPDCVLDEIMPYIKQCGKDCKFINVGAGDILF